MESKSNRYTQIKHNLEKHRNKILEYKKMIPLIPYLLGEANNNMFKKMKKDSNTTKMSFENTSKIRNIFSKNTKSKKEIARKDYSLRDAIAGHLYSPPRGLIITLKEKISLLMYFKKPTSKKQKNVDKNQVLESENDIGYVEVVSLHILNDRLVKTIKERKPFEVFLPLDNR